MRIVSVDYYLPEKVVTNGELLEMIEKNCVEHVDLSGIEKKLQTNRAITRHFMAPNETVLDMAEKAAKKCLRKAGFLYGNVDVIIYVGMAKDFVEPSTAVMLRQRLGLNAHLAFDLTNACMGFLNALEMAKFYTDISGKKYNVLIVGAETGSRWIPWNDFSKENNLAGFSSLTVADGAGAMLLEPGCFGESLKTFEFNTYSEYSDLCQISVGKGEDDLKLHVKSRELAATAIKIMGNFIPKFIDKSVRVLGDINIWFLHQVTGAPRGFCGNLDERLFNKYYYSFPSVGNLGSVSIPVGMALAEEEGKLKRGDRVSLIVGASGFLSGGTYLIY